MPESNKSTDWETNHAVILEAFQRYLKENEKRPTNKKLAELTGLHENTIKNHFKEMDKIPLSQRYSSLRLRTGELLEACFNHGKDGGQGGAAYSKLYLQAMEGFSESQKIEHSGNLNLSNLTDEELEKKKKELEDILDDSDQ